MCLNSFSFSFPHRPSHVYPQASMVSPILSLYWFWCLFCKYILPREIQSEFEDIFTYTCKPAHAREQHGHQYSSWLQGCDFEEENSHRNAHQVHLTLRCTKTQPLRGGANLGPGQGFCSLMGPDLRFSKSLPTRSWCSH